MVQTETKFLIAPWALAAGVFLFEFSGMREGFESLLPGPLSGIPWSNVGWGMAGVCAFCSFRWAFAYEQRLGRKECRLLAWTFVSGLGMFLAQLAAAVILLSRFLAEL